MCANDIAFSLRGDFDSIQFDPSKVSKIDICRKSEGLFASYLTNYLSKIPRSAGYNPRFGADPIRLEKEQTERDFIIDVVGWVGKLCEVWKRESERRACIAQ